jgi:hypothetical protein
MRSIARRVRSRSPFRRRRKASELIGDIRNLEIDYQESNHNADLPEEADAEVDEGQYQTRRSSEHESHAETSAIEIVLESSKPDYEQPSMNLTTGRGRNREMRTPRIKAVAAPAPVPELVRTMSTTDSEYSPENKTGLGGGISSPNRSKRMSFRDRFMSKKRPSPVRGRGRSVKRIEAPAESSKAFGQSARHQHKPPVTRNIALLDDEVGDGDDSSAVNASIPKEQLTPPRSRILTRWELQERELYGNNTKGNSNGSDYNEEKKNDETVDLNLPMTPPALKKECSGLSGIPVEELHRDHSLLDNTAGAPPPLFPDVLSPSAQGMTWSDTPYSVQVNAQQLARVPVSAITTPGALSGKASWSDSEDEDDDSTDSTDSRDNKSKAKHNHAKNNEKNKKNEKRQEGEPQKPAPSFTHNRSIGEDSIDKVRRALEEVEEELDEAQKSGKKISRETLAQALFSVADKLESPEECISMRRQVSRFLANDKKNGCYDHDDDEDNGILSQAEWNDSKRAVNNSRQRQQQQQQGAGARNPGSHSRHHTNDDKAGSKIKGASSWESSKLDESRSAGSESGFTAWAAELEDDDTSFDFDAKPEGDFFSDVYDFFAGGDNKVKRKRAPRNVRSWDDADADSKTTGFTGFDSPRVDEEDDEDGVFAGLESSPPVPRNRYEPPTSSSHVNRGPSLVIDKSNDYELPPPPHAMRSQPLFGARSTIQHSTANHQTAPSSKSASKRNKAKPTRSSGPTWRSLSPKKERVQDPEDDDILSLSSIESAQYQGRRDSRPQSRGRIPDDDAVMMTVLSMDEDEVNESADLGSNRRDFHLRQQRTSTQQQRQRSRSAHAPRQRSFKDGVAARMLI